VRVVNEPSLFGSVSGNVRKAILLGKEKEVREIMESRLGENAQLLTAGERWRTWDEAKKEIQSDDVVSALRMYAGYRAYFAFAQSSHDIEEAILHAWPPDQLATSASGGGDSSSDPFAAIRLGYAFTHLAAAKAFDGELRNAAALSEWTSRQAERLGYSRFLRDIDRWIRNHWYGYLLQAAARGFGKEPEGVAALREELSASPSRDTNKQVYEALVVTCLSLALSEAERFEESQEMLTNPCGSAEPSVFLARKVLVGGDVVQGFWIALGFGGYFLFDMVTMTHLVESLLAAEDLVDRFHMHLGFRFGLCDDMLIRYLR
jgi:hypothetical protein